MFVGKQFAGAANAGLDFVDDEGQVLGPAIIGDGLDVGAVKDVDAAFALDAFQHDGAGAVGDGGLKGVDVIRGHVGEARINGHEGFVQGGLAGGGQGGHGAAVEAVGQGDDVGAAGAVTVKAGLPRQLDGAFVGFGAAVSEKNGVKGGDGAKPVGQANGRQGVIKVGGVLQLAGLLADRLDPVGIAVAQGVDADAGAEIQIGLAVDVGGQAAAALDQDGVIGSVGREHMGLVGFFDVFCLHGNLLINHGADAVIA